MSAFTLPAPDSLFLGQASWPLLETIATETERWLARIARRRATQPESPGDIREANTATLALGHLIKARKDISIGKREQEESGLEGAEYAGGSDGNEAAENNDFDNGGQSSVVIPGDARFPLGPHVSSRASSGHSQIVNLNSPVSAPSTPISTPPSVIDATNHKDLCAHSLRDFALTFFPGFCRTQPFSDLHEYLFARRDAKIAIPSRSLRPEATWPEPRTSSSVLCLPPPIPSPPFEPAVTSEGRKYGFFHETREGRLDVVLAPRGAAKSTLVSLIFPAHAMLYGNERYIVLISATQAQANQRLAILREALLNNPRLREYFPGKLEKLTRLNARAIEMDGVRIEARSATSEMRGIGFGAWRPTWIILDDVERSERVRSARHRDAHAAWFSEIVANLGDSYTHIDLIGTLLHRDALPARLAQRPDVAYRAFQSIIREADDTALWDQWRALLTDLADPQRVTTAYRFYQQHMKAMNEGAKVLWPKKENYYALQKLRETQGRAAFDKEKQNMPWADGASIFASFPLRRFRVAGGLLVCDPSFAAPGAVSPTENGLPEVSLAGLRCFGFLDPSLGSPSGDFAAIATVGVDPAGYAYLLDVWIARAGPSEQIQRAFDLHERWNYQLFGVETNAFQKLLLEPFEAERARRKAQGRPWDLAIHQERNRADKASRILALEPLARNGWLLWNADLSEKFRSQLLDFPNAAHDDGPDAAAAAVKLARETSRAPLSLSHLPRRTPIRNF